MTAAFDMPPAFETPPDWRWGTLMTPDGRKLRYGMNDDANARGIVLVLPGMGDFAEKYFEVVRDLAAWHLAVCALDWFDQGGSGRNLSGTTRRHSEGFDRDCMDARLFLDQIVKPRLWGRPLMILGHSMGGHLGLRLLLQHPGDFAAAAFSAPMVRIQAVSFLPDNGWLSLTRLMVKHSPTHFVPGGHEWTPKDRAFPGHNIFSSDPVRDRVHAAWVDRHPELAVGSATWGWVHHALHSCIALEAEAATPPSCPVLLASAGKDMFVNTAAIRALVARWSGAQGLHLPSAKHEILMETDDIRMQFWQGFDRLIEPVFNQPKGTGEKKCHHLTTRSA